MQYLAYVNQARIRSWNQPVLSNKSSFLLKETTGAFDRAWTHDWQVSTDQESDTLPTAPRRLYLNTIWSSDDHVHREFFIVFRKCLSRDDMMLNSNLP